MINGSKRFFEMGGTVFPDSQQTIRERSPTRTKNSIEALANCLGNGSRHAFAGGLGEFLDQSVGFVIFDVQAHWCYSIILLYLSTIMQTTTPYLWANISFSCVYSPHDRDLRDVDRAGP